MANSLFKNLKPAVYSTTKAKINLIGASGAGKTGTAIRILSRLLHGEGKIIVFDTERVDENVGASTREADNYSFDVLPVPSDLAPLAILDIMKEAVSMGYDGIVYDSFTDEWAVGYMKRKEELKDTYSKIVKPEHEALMRWISDAPVHIILTQRGKKRFDFAENANGKTVPTKVIDATLGADDVDYYMQLELYMVGAEKATVSKTRLREFRMQQEIDIRGTEFLDVIVSAHTNEDLPKTKLGFQGAIGRLGLRTSALIKQCWDANPSLGSWTLEKHEEMLEVVKIWADAHIIDKTA